MRNNFKKIDSDKAIEVISSHVDFYSFQKKFCLWLLESLRKYEGKQISRRIKNQIHKDLESIPEFFEKVRWISYEKQPSYCNDEASYRLEIRMIDNAFGQRDRIIRINLSENQEKFSIEKFESINYVYRSKWVEEYEADLKKAKSVAKKWNKIMDSLKAIEDDMKGIPSELYVGRY